MQKQLVVTGLLMAFVLSAQSQDGTAKEKAEVLARNEFSKEEHKKIEKYGVTKEKHKAILSTPVVKADPSFYQGNYWVQGFNHQLEIRQDPQGEWLVTLTMNGEKTVLKNVTINDAYFTALKPSKDGTDEVWEGAFINKTDDGATDFGLGIKLPRPTKFQSINIVKFFFKKVSP